MVRGGWSNLRRINYYTKFLGLDGRIEREHLVERPEVNDNMMKVIQMQNDEISKLRKEIIQIIGATVNPDFDLTKLKELPLQEVKVKNV